MSGFEGPTRDLKEFLLAVDRIGAEKVLTGSLSEHSPAVVAEKVIAAALEEVGRAWENGDLALSQVYMSSRIAEDLVDKLFPAIETLAPATPIVALCVLEDYHMLGKRMVQSALRASGMAAHDYGRVTVEEAVERVREDGVRILMVSTLMLRSALRVKALKESLDAEGLDVQLIVGGAPFRFDPELWQEVGADAMGGTATDAVKLVEKAGEAAA